MANPIKGEARLGDHTLAFNFGAFCQLEEKTDKKVPILLQMMNDGLGFLELRDFVWAGLLANNPAATDEDAGRVCDENGFEAAAEAVGKAVTNFFGSQRAKGKNPPEAE